MDFDRTGLILYTKDYHTCAQFYEEIFELPVLFKKKELTCFALGDTYLMVEQGTEEEHVKNGIERIRTCIRMNVSNIRERADSLISKGIQIDYQVHSWGTVAKFFDPDGNLCALKDSESFEEQIRGYQHES